MVEARLLRENPDFRLLWVAELARYLAGGLRRVAVPWLVLVLTGSPLQLGLAFALQTTPDIVAAPVLGRAIDRHSRRWLLVGAAVLAGGAVLVIPAAAWLVGPTVGVVYAVLVALSVFDSLYHNAREAVLPTVVAERNLDAANAYFTGASSFVGVLFLGVGGVLTSVVGPYPTIAASGVVTAAGAPLVALLDEPDRDGTADDGSLLGLREYGRTLRAGLAAIRGTVAQDLLLVGIVINVAVVPYSLLLATVSERAFDAAVAFGLLLAAVRIGSLGGNYLAPRLSVARERLYAGGIVATGVAALVVAAVGTGLAGLPTLAYGAALALALAGFGAAMPLFNVPSDSLVQLAVGDDTRGRVVTLTNASVQLGFPVGYLAAGWLVDRVSPFAVFAMAGVLLLALGTVVAARFLGWAAGRAPEQSGT